MVGTLIRRPLPPVSDFIRTLLDDADATAALATLGIVSSTFTPTLTNTTNLSASTAFATAYVRIGTHVVVWGVANADAVAAASTLTEMGMSLPVASNFADVTQLAGSGAFAGTTVNCPVAIIADATNDRASFTWASQTAVNGTMGFMFGYRVI